MKVNFSPDTANFTHMLHSTYSTESAETLLQKPGTLAVFAHDGSCQMADNGVIHSGIIDFSSNKTLEVWSLPNNTVVSGKTGSILWRKSDNLIAASYYISPEEWTSIEGATYACYESLLNVASQMGYTHPVRFWNFLPCINQGDGDSEAYKRFCTGRLQAFNDLGLENHHYPAASAVGHHQTGAIVTLFACTQPGQHHQNKKQINAFQYPREYGVSSPSFARATSLFLDNHLHLFISGTASIIGHQTIAEDSLNDQIYHTCNNIKHLLKNHSSNTGNLQSIKVYLRYSEHLLAAQIAFKEYFSDCPIIFTEADICRSDLLIEAECFFCDSL